MIGDPLEKEIAVASLREGAMDYLLKNHMDARTLDRVLRGAVERNTLKGLGDLLRDPLTGLYIRDGFLKLGSHIMDSAKERGGTLALLCVRFENLERIRKELGQNKLTGDIARLRKLTADNPAQQNSLAEIEEVLNEDLTKLAVPAKTVRAEGSGRIANSLAWAGVAETTARFRALFDHLEATSAPC